MNDVSGSHTHLYGRDDGLSDTFTSGKISARLLTSYEYVKFAASEYLE